jgi:hypothetical protein
LVGHKFISRQRNVPVREHFAGRRNVSRCAST